MKLYLLSFAILFAAASAIEVTRAQDLSSRTATASTQTNGPIVVVPSQPGETNKFEIHLQEGFYEGREAAIKVDGREVYRGTPHTSEFLGVAKMIRLTVRSTHPVVIFTMPSKRVNWSKEIDLKAGAMLGIGLTTNAVVETRQATQFGYD